jgi:D-beta-D-heptose 7-phosphate kinase/D-beta-D-heptose 1-phosphate adenosyltransferase
MIENSVLFDDLHKTKGRHLLCIGDVMLDNFIYGSIDRISPEAPIPVLLVSREKTMLGGAGNVVANIHDLGVQTTLLAIVGNDTSAAIIKDRLQEIKATENLVAVQGRATTVKNRFICGSQQMLRVDNEVTTAIDKDAEDKIISLAEKAMGTVDAIILSDYKKGALTDRVVTEIIALAKKHNKPIIVDPKGQDFARYKGATVITPNKKELEAATGMDAGTDEAVRAACMKIITTCGIQTVLATRGKDGMSLISADDAPLHIPANVREVFDVSGAGDTVVATFAAAVSAGVPLKNAALLANIAAGIVVGKTGTATARPEEIVKALEEGVAAKTRDTFRKTKLVTAAAAAEQAERWRVKGAKVGFTNGTFDLLHPGHISSIQQAKAACDYLVVAINSDASVKRYKGPTRPVQDQAARATILSAMEIVDLVVIFDEDTPIELLKTIKPDVLVKGGQYKLEEVVGYDIVMGYGGKIVRADMEDGFSTTNTIQKMAS